MKGASDKMKYFISILYFGPSKLPLGKERASQRVVIFY